VINYGLGMDDREIVAAIATGDQDGLAAAYDEHAESLYGYCRWMLGEPEDAADALEDTFVVAAARLGGLRDPRKLRPWLYAVARNECHRRLRAAEAGLGEEDGEEDTAAEGRGSQGAELSRLARAALGGLNPDEREVIELDLRHDLHGADLAAVLGVPRTQAHTLVSRARDRLESELGTLIVARTGRRACAGLDLLLGDWDGRLTTLTRKRVSQHIGQCEACAGRSGGGLRRAVLHGMTPLVVPPPGLRGEVLQLCADPSPRARSYLRGVAERAGPFGPNGFPQPVRAPRRRMLALSGVAAAVGVLIALTATGIVTVLALTGSHSPRQAAAGSRQPPGTASSPAAGDTGAADGPSAGGPSSASAPAVSGAPPQAASPTVSAARPSPSHPATSPATVTPTPKMTLVPPTPTATGTPTGTATATPTPTPTRTLPF
jgi:RNA polymerase sigma factor (sigma-70 family)